MPARESISGPLRIAISGPSAIHDATLAARDFAEGAGIEGGDVSRLAIIVEELVTNLFDHGGLKAEDAFEVELTATATDIEVIITDCGRAFDPGVATFPSAVPARGGGAGIRLLRDWASHTEYRTSGMKNRLAVVLPRSAGRSGEPKL